VVLLVSWIPLSHLFFALPTIFAERLLYLPAAAFAIAVARLATRHLDPKPIAAPPPEPKPEPKRGKKAAKKQKPDPAPVEPAKPVVDQAAWRRAAIVVAPVLVLNLALAWQRAKVWRDDHTLFEAAIEVVPNSARAHQNYGAALLNEGKASLAIPEFKRASEILPSWSEPHALLGAALFDTGRTSEAEAHFRKAVELEPDAPKAVYNLAAFLAREGRLDETKAVLEPFVRKFPGRTREASLLRRIEAALASPDVKKP